MPVRGMRQRGKSGTTSDHGQEYPNYVPDVEERRPGRKREKIVLSNLRRDEQEKKEDSIISFGSSRRHGRSGERQRAE